MGCPACGWFFIACGILAAVWFSYHPPKPLAIYQGEERTYAQGVVDGRAAIILEMRARDRQLIDAGLCGYAKLVCKEGRKP